MTGPGGAREPSEAYTQPATYLSEARPIAADPVQHGRPSAVLIDPAPVEARAAVRNVDRGEVSDDEVEDLVVAVSETVTNAVRHGRAPVEVRVWPGGDRIVVTVSDAGPGPADPFAGLMPSADTRHFRARSLDHLPVRQPRDHRAPARPLHHPADRGQPALDGAAAQRHGMGAAAVVHCGVRTARRRRRELG